MAERKRMNTASCPVARALDVVGDRWSLLIVRDAFDGVSRFSDFQASLGVARNILASRLKALVEEGVLEAEPASDGTAYHQYVLTPKGQTLFPVIVGLRQWGERNLFRRGERHSRLVERATGKPVARLEVADAEGRALAFGDVVVVEK
ncbi:winged helix-turn-helix transcriptional regulator [Variovorax saccharolyticus]|uniref:winged helix-turn-helix transcriptional regulator n=1 Tax=Variovorax saccharolyticus TaxID=3053516 RepID=UPI002574FE86|nr:helix-turn-helix domain-containing protein [Variovorax sp. J31P216]MDM0029184.1 helix-turn-helix domain-containing protein [Variovorax sp. J31P216]